MPQTPSRLLTRKPSKPTPRTTSLSSGRNTSPLSRNAWPLATRSHFELAAEKLKKDSKLKLGGVLNMKFKKKLAIAACKGVDPFIKEPCVLKAKPTVKTVSVLPMKKFKVIVN